MSFSFRTSSRLLPIVVAALGLLVLSCVLLPLKNPVSLDDGLRHYMMGKEMGEQGILQVRGWSRWFFAGYLHDHPVDPWFLSDVLYLPFTVFPLIPALKLFALFSIAFLLASFLLCLRSMRVGPVASAFLVFLLLFGNQEFTFRLLFGRPFVVVTAVTMLLFLCVIRQRPLLVAILMAVATLLSQLFVFPFVISILGCALFWWRGESKVSLRLFLASMIGLTFGFLLHPFPLEYVRYIWLIFLPTSSTGFPDRGSEMFSGFGNEGLLFVVGGLIVLLHVLWMKKRKLKIIEQSVLLLEAIVVMFLILFLLYSRAIDFLWPFVLLLLGVLLAHEGHTLRKIGTIVFPAGVHRVVLMLCLMLLLCALFFLSGAVNLLAYDRERSLIPMQRALEKLPPRSRVLNVDWDTFPFLVAVRPDLQYAFGMDPIFIYASNSGSYALIRMTHSIVRLPDERKYLDAKRWVEALTAIHPSDYVLLSAQKMEPIIEGLDRAGFENVSDDPEWAVFRVPPAKTAGAEH